MVGDRPPQEANVGPFQIKTRRGWQSFADFVRRHTRVIGLWAVLSSVLIVASAGFQENRHDRYGHRICVFRDKARNSAE